MSTEGKLFEVMERSEQCMVMAFENSACFAVVRAALEGASDADSKSLCNLDISQVVSLLELFEARSEEMSALMSSVNQEYMGIVKGLESQAFINGIDEVAK